MQTNRHDPTDELADEPAANTDTSDAREVLVALRTVTRENDDGEATTREVVEEMYGETDAVIHGLDGEEHRPDRRGFIWLVGTVLADFDRLGFVTRVSDASDANDETEKFTTPDPDVRWVNPDVAGYYAFMADEGDETADAQGEQDEQGDA